MEVKEKDPLNLQQTWSELDAPATSTCRQEYEELTRI